MSDHRWTPGPWGWEVDGCLYGGWDNGWLYDDVISATGECEHKPCEFIAIPKTRILADRQLIALAPEMAEAILACVDTEGYTPFTDAPGMTTAANLRNVADKLRAIGDSNE